MDGQWALYIRDRKDKTDGEREREKEKEREYQVHEESLELGILMKYIPYRMITYWTPHRQQS